MTKTENQIRAEKLGCYCEIWDDDPSFFEEKVPKGYCGLCDVCGSPGHVRHFPGAIACTDCRCDKHYRRAMWLHPLGAYGVGLWLGGISAVYWVVKWLMV